MLVRSALVSRIGNSPLTVVRAPGGAGKTVLLAQWAGEQQMRGVWITVEPDIGGRAVFWNSVFESIAARGLGPGARFEDVANGGELSSALIRAFRGVTVPFVLVIDDAHELVAAVIEDLLSVLIACPGVSAVAGTRTRSELEAPRHGLTLDITAIGPEELVLSAADIAAIVGDAGSPYGSTTELLEASGGNPLLLRAILAGSSAGAGARLSASVVVLDFLHGLFTSEGAAFATFASTTAVPDDVDITLAARLSGMPEASVETLLESLENDGLVMRRDTPEGARYRYHPLVREVLRAELKRTDPDRFREASVAASAVAEQRQHFLPALRHAVDAEDYSRASDVCLHGAFPLIRSRGAAAILAQVPVRYVARYPFFAIVLGLAANARGERWKALQLLTLALGASRAGRSRQRVAERIGLALIETVILRITGRADDAVAPAKRMLELLDDAAPTDLEEIANQLGSYRLQAAVSLFRAGHLVQARIAAEQVGASEHALAEGSSESLGAASLIAAVEAVRGENKSAAEALALIDGSEYPADMREGYVGSLGALARGILALEAMDADGAAEQLDVFVDRENLEYGTLFAVARAFVELWRDAPDVGLRSLKEREQNDRPRARQSAEDRLILTVTRVLLHAAAHQLSPAYEALRDIERSTPAAVVLRAQLYLLEQRPDLAIDELSGVSLPSEPRLQASADLLMAVASLLRDDETVAESALRRFFATLQVHGTLSPVVLVAAEHRELLYEFSHRIGAKAITLERLRSVPEVFSTTTQLAALTPRETEVLEQLRKTASFAEIAANLHVSANTIKTQVRGLYRKLGVSGRDEALRAAYLQGLLLEDVSNHID